MAEIFQKMKIDMTSKFGVDQEVFYMSNNEVKSSKVCRIMSSGGLLNEHGKVIEILFTYHLYNGAYITEEILYGSKEALLKSL